MKRVLSILLLVATLGSYLVSCDFSLIEDIVPESWLESAFEGMPTAHSEGLEFILRDDKASYAVLGVGTCTDEDIVIPDSYNGLPVTSIRRFRDPDVKRVIIPDSVTTIELAAFDHCYSLTAVRISKSVTQIDSGSFECCTALETIYVDRDNPNYKSIDGNLYSKDKKTLIKYAIGKDETSFTIPDYVTSIGRKAFAECKHLKNVVMPDSVTSVAPLVFYRCSSLESIRLSNSIQEISWCMFEECDSLTNIVIPKTVKKIDQSAFESCDSLAKIEIPEFVTSIGYYAFSHCKSLQSANIPNSVTEIGAYAFAFCTSLNKIVIPSSVERIDGFAFKGCSSLTIYCRDKQENSNWHPYWMDDDQTVVWGYVGN